MRACGVKSKEMRVSVRELSLCLCVCEIYQGHFRKSLANGNNPKTRCCAFSFMDLRGP